MEGKEVRFGAAACGCLGRRDDGHVERRGQLHARLVHAARRHGADDAHDVRRDLAGRCRCRPDGHAHHFALLAVFIAGLMVGRTPEYLGKKIQAPEMKLVTLYILAMPFALLAFAAASVMLRQRGDVPAGPARPVGGALQLRLGRQQQRLGVRLPGHRHPVVHGHAGHRRC